MDIKACSAGDDTEVSVALWICITDKYKETCSVDSVLRTCRWKSVRDLHVCSVCVFEWEHKQEVGVICYEIGGQRVTALR